LGADGATPSKQESRVALRVPILISLVSAHLQVGLSW
jgi:hypothetical protein